MRPGILRAGSLALLIAAPICVVLLHVLSPGLEPRSHRLSEYANGPYGYVMTIAFLTLGAGLLALAAALHALRKRVWLPGAVPVGVALAGVGMAVSGLVPTDPDPASSMREAIHSQASGLASVALIASALLWLFCGRRRTPRGWRPTATAGAFAVAATVLAVASPWLHRSTWTGLSQRALWSALLGWLVAVLWWMRPSPAARVGVDRSAVSAGAGTTDG